MIRSGEVTLGDNESVELADARVSSGVAGDVYLNGAAMPENATIFSLHGIARAEQAPDRARCVELLSARRDDRIRATDAGKWLCVNTDQGTIAALRVVSAPAIGSPRLVFEYTLWR